MREIKFRFWDPYRKIMSADHRDATIWNGLLVCEGDTMPLQYTGLKDKNGVEIYEGDVIEIDYGAEKAHQLVDFKDGCFGIYWMEDAKRRSFIEFTYYPDDVFAGGREVIGNIYENPELVEAKS